MASVARPVKVKLCLLGFGNVGRGFCELVAAQEDELAREFGLRFVVTAIGTRHGSLLEPEGLRAGEALARTKAGLPSPARPADELIAASGAGVLVEATVMEHAGAPTATAHIERLSAAASTWSPSTKARWPMTTAACRTWRSRWAVAGASRAR